MSPISPPPSNFTAPLVQRLCDLYKLFHSCLLAFPKQERYTLGQRIESTILDALELISSAQYQPRSTKLNKILQASDKVDILKYLIRLSCETKSLTPKRYGILATHTVETGRMLGGWIRSLQ